jgi:hypothetical protein
MVVKGGRLQGGYKRKCYAGHKHDHRKGDPLLAFFLFYKGFVFRDRLMSAYGNLVYWRGSPGDCAAIYLITKRLTTNDVPHCIAYVSFTNYSTQNFEICFKCGVEWEVKDRFVCSLVWRVTSVIGTTCGHRSNQQLCCRLFNDTIFHLEGYLIPVIAGYIVYFVFHLTTLYFVKYIYICIYVCECIYIYIYIILVNNQLDAQFFFSYIFITIL